MGEDRRDITFYTFDWELKVKKLAKPGDSRVTSNNLRKHSDKELTRIMSEKDGILDGFKITMSGLVN